MDTARATVLVVEDEPAVAHSFEIMLEDEYDLKTAYDGEEALEIIGDDGDDVDVVLLDRMMPGMSGDDVLVEIRDQNVDCRIAMVTAVDPDFDILEMGFDGYVTKPPTGEQLKRTVADLLENTEYGERLREYRSLLAKRSVLEAEKDPKELEESEEFSHLEERIEDARRDLDEDNEALLDDTRFVGALRNFDDDGEEGAADGSVGE